MDWFKIITGLIGIIIIVAVVTMSIAAAQYHSDVMKLCKLLNGQMIGEVCVRKAAVINAR